MNERSFEATDSVNATEMADTAETTHAAKKDEKRSSTSGRHGRSSGDRSTGRAGSGSSAGNGSGRGGKSGGRASRGGNADVEHKARILAAAEELFSTQGFHGTGLREVADKAGVSLGNIYNHFATKEALFEGVLADLEKKYLDPDQPLVRALLEADFPAEIEKLGEASAETVKQFASYIRLIYVDVLEFKGAHVARLYGGMKHRYEKVYGERFAKMRAEGQLGDVDPVIAAMMATITYMYYFTVEHLFGVKKHYGLDDGQVIREFARVFRNGILPRK